LFPVDGTPVGWPWVAPPGVVLRAFDVAAGPPAADCPARPAGPLCVPPGCAGELTGPDGEGVTREAGCPLGWSGGGRWPEPDCDMTTATAIPAATTTAAMPAATVRRRAANRGAGAPPGEAAA
jgi:hypothetical protein